MDKIYLLFPLGWIFLFFGWKLIQANRRIPGEYDFGDDFRKTFLKVRPKYETNFKDGEKNYINPGIIFGIGVVLQVIAVIKIFFS